VIYCRLPTIFAASKGRPIGLTRNAITNRINPFCMEYVSRTANAKMLTMELANENTNAEQDSKPQQIQTNRSINITTGNNKIFNTVLI
jgi:hypothetical protein